MAADTTRSTVADPPARAAMSAGGTQPTSPSDARAGTTLATLTSRAAGSAVSDQSAGTAVSTNPTRPGVRTNPCGADTRNASAVTAGAARAAVSV